jgi:hypothetical protein
LEDDGTAGALELGGGPLQSKPMEWMPISQPPEEP